MFYRRKLLLSLLEKVGKTTAQNVIQNLLFLISQENPVYTFIPSEEGPLSLTLESDWDLFRKEPWQESDIEEKDAQLVRETVEAWQKEGEKLLLRVAEMYPYFTIKSSREFSKATEEKKRALIKMIEAAPKGLYTVGYEGITIEDFINKLIKNNIKRVIDVRGNPNSRKREFAKNSLAASLARVGIEYIGMKEIGVPNKIKREYLKAGRKEELFQWYEENVLVNSKPLIKEINTLTKEVNTVLVCYEANPADCHRSHLATFCKRELPALTVTHLV
ncbi:MAG: DUF488 domain-containing protein [Sphaerochaetaceae bacterium]